MVTYKLQFRTFGPYNFRLGPLLSIPNFLECSLAYFWTIHFRPNSLQPYYAQKAGFITKIDILSLALNLAIKK